MAKILSSPIPVPQITASNMDNYDKACEKYLKDIIALAKRRKGGLIGKIVRIGVADGYATYVVWREKPLELIHIDTWDGWRFRYDYLLTIEEIKDLTS